MVSIASYRIKIASIYCHFAIWIFLLGPAVAPLPAFPCQVAGAPPSPGNGWAKQQDFQALQAACKKFAGPRNTCKSQLGQLLQWMDNGQGARSIQAYVVRFQRIEMRWMPCLKHFYPFRTSSNSTVSAWRRLVQEKHCRVLMNGLLKCPKMIHLKKAIRLPAKRRQTRRPVRSKFQSDADSLPLTCQAIIHWRISRISLQRGNWINWLTFPCNPYFWCDFVRRPADLCKGQCCANELTGKRSPVHESTQKYRRVSQHSASLWSVQRMGYRNVHGLYWDFARDKVT